MHLLRNALARAQRAAVLVVMFAGSSLLAQLKSDSPAADSPASSDPKTDSAVVLSPFEVVTDTKGYYGASTMSGTRLNTKLEDLASSITVVTKEQMKDFAMLDINDIFNYTASTEGTGTFTDYSVSRFGDVSDNVQLNPTQANRVRGIAAANIARGNVEVSGRTPLDPLDNDGVEISRGPNSSVFGLGNGGGTVNAVPAAANLSRAFSQVQVRGDSYGGYRTSLDLDRPLVRSVLAVRGSAAFQHDAFERKPSGVNNERYNGMIKYQPFKSTTISASYSFYRMNGNRPNSTPPRDSVSYWAQSGKPTWDPVTQTIHLNGKTLGPFTNDTALPDYFQRQFTGSILNQVFVGPGGLAYWTSPNGTANANDPATAPASAIQPDRLVATSPSSGAPLGLPANQPLFATSPSVSSKSVYDWSSINLASMNRVMDRNSNAAVTIDQTFINTAQQTLSAQLSFNREDSQRYQRNPYGTANNQGATGQFLIDVNERLLDGSPNPFFLHPYIGIAQPVTSWQPLRWDTYRAQLAYRFDFTQNKGWTKWLGTHQLSGYDEYKYRIQRTYNYRDAIADQHPWVAQSLSRGNVNAVTGGPARAGDVIRSYFRYYVGNNGPQVNYAPGDFRYGTYPFVWGNGVTGVFHQEPALLSQVADTDGTGGASNTKKILKTEGVMLQSHFYDDRIVTTFGLREDRQYFKQGATPQQVLPTDGTQFNYDSLNHWAAGDYSYNEGKTHQGGAVVRPFRGQPFLRAWDKSGGMGHLVAELLNGLSVSYNKSDSFQPQDPRVNLFLQQLPNTTGRGEDYGVSLNLFDGKLVARWNHYTTKTLDARLGDTATIAQRVTRIDITSTAPFVLTTVAAGPSGWIRTLHPTWTDAQVQDEFSKEVGLSTSTINALIQDFNASTIASTQDIIGKGDEIELNFNPTRFWTAAVSVTRTQAFNANVSNDIQNWINLRMPIWTTLVDPVKNSLWWTTNYGGTQTAAQNFASFVQTPYNVDKQTQGKALTQIREYNFKLSTRLQLAAITEQKFLQRVSVGGSLRWEDRGSIGYYGVQDATGVYTALDPNRPIWDKSHYFLDAVISYRAPRFWSNRIGATFQLNVRNLQESGHLQPIAAFPDGTPEAYRIVDPRQFILSATFDL